jgi:hypothetical protein
MIKFRQKMYIALPAAGALLSKAGGLTMKGLNLAGQASMVGSVVQSQQQMNQAEQHQQQNARLQKQQMIVEQQKADAINNLAKSPAGQTPAAQAVQQGLFSEGKVLKNQKLFAMRYNMQDIKGFGKDLGNHIWKNKKHIGGFVGFGVAMTGGKYLADKMIQKDKSVMPQQNEENKQKVYSEVKKQVSPKKGKNIISKLGGAGLGMGLAMGALQPLGSYIGDKTQQQSISKKSEERQFANPSIFRRGINAIKRSGWGSRQNMNVIDSINNEKSKVYDPRTWKWLKKVKHNPARGLANVYNSFNMMGGETGMKSFQNSLTGQGTSGSRLSKDIANFTKKHGATSMAAIGAIGGGALFKSSELAEKGTEKTLRAIDKNAFKYTDSKEEEMK